MDKGITYELVRDQFVAIKDLNQGYVTNFFTDAATFGLWRKHNGMDMSVFDQSARLLRQNEGFYNLYFASTTPKQLTQELPLFLAKNDKQPIVVDLVGRDKDIPPTEQALLDNGFEPYCSLVRMSRPITTQEPTQTDIKYATQNQTEQINVLLHQYFDPLCEQLPLVEQIERWVADKRVLIREIDGKIAGFLIFEIHGVTSYLRYWFTHPDYRNQKVGSSLLRQFFTESNATKRQIFWVIEDNENAVVRYRHYGFKEENMYNKVLIFRY